MQETSQVTHMVEMGSQFWIATAIFLIAYAIIISERVHKTIVAMVGSALMIVLGVLTQEEAYHSTEFGVDWNVIVLLVSMMIIVDVMKPTGVFEYIAIKSAKIAKGEPFKIMALLAIITAGVSALLDNVTTVLLIAPVTVLICKQLKLDFVPFLIVEAIASNIGGTATLVGDPPNIMIASKAKLGFMDFIYNLTPVVIIILIVFIITLKLIFGKRLQVSEDLKQKVMAMNEKEAIKDTVLLKKSLIIVVFATLGFIFHGVLHYEPATIALISAATLLLIANVKEPHHILAAAEWSTLFFFMGLFIIIGGIVKVGLITWVSTQVVELTQGNLFATSMVILWFSAFASAIVDNIPFVATMNPLVIQMAEQLWPNLSGTELLHHPDLMPIWWSLALGACLGGNGTLIGASANVVVAGIAEKSGAAITFMRFTLYGIPLMIESVFISMIYIWVRYYILKI